MLLLLSLLCLTAVNAAPIESNAAVCTVALTATNHGGAMANYYVNIGRPYIEGVGCGPINQTLVADVEFGVYPYQCFTVDDGASTNLAFVSATGPSTNIEVVESLQKAYPMVPFQKKRICLMDGVDAPSSWKSLASKRTPGFFDDLLAYFDMLAYGLGITDDDGPIEETEEKRTSYHKSDQIITPEIDAAIREAGIVQRASSTVGLYLGDLDLDEETVDAIMKARKMSMALNHPTKRNHNVE